MSILLLVLLVVVFLAALGIFADEWGVDSRDGIGDTHAP